MKHRKVKPLRDEGRAVIEAEIESNRKLIERYTEEYENMEFGREESSSVPTVSGGRPESKRSKF
jgi:hypothetical protein